MTTAYAHSLCSGRDPTGYSGMSEEGYRTLANILTFHGSKQRYCGIMNLSLVRLQTQLSKNSKKEKEDMVSPLVSPTLPED